MNLTVTDRAAAELIRVIREQGLEAGSLARVHLDAGSGDIRLTMVEPGNLEIRPDDIDLTQNTVKLLLERKIAVRNKSIHIDFQDTPEARGFLVAEV